VPDFDPDELSALAQEDLEEIVARVQAGAKNAKEALDFDEGSMAAIEEVALNLYRSEMYDKAALVYGFALRLDPDRASCWRGLGAVAQVSKGYQLAILCYSAALDRDPDDLISLACLGECFCLDGRPDPGRALLRRMVARAEARPELSDYVARARAVLEGE
jgi:tetratricopeptide (TPR) repeat protein